MDAIDVMSHGHWKPSPGSMYPLLSKAVVEDILTEIDSNLSYLEDLTKEKLTPHIPILEEIREKVIRLHETLHSSGPET